VAVRVSARSGYDLEYMLKGQARDGKERTAGGYYMNAAQAGEATGRWYGAGAAALGFAPGSQVAPDPFRQVYSQVNPQTGEQLGRRPGGYAKFTEIFARLQEAESHATAERLLQLEREAAKAARRSPVYTDSAAEFDKTISVVHASIRENARRAHLAGDIEAERAWTAREQRWQEVLQEAALVGIEYMAYHAGWTRTGYHGKRVDGVEPGRWERALPVVTAWLQGTNRDGEPHDHVHVVWARMAQTATDGKWRSLDTMRIRGHLGGMAAAVAAYAESALTREFGVEWVARKDGLGNELRGVTQEWKDAYSTRTQKVDAKQRELAASFEAKYGRAPNQREMLFIRHAARDQSKRAKKNEAIDWDKLTEGWDSTVGGRLAGLADQVLGARHPGQASETPSADLQEAAIVTALDRVQREHSTWTRADLLKVLGWACGPEFAYMDPDARQDLLQDMATRAISAEFAVVCLEAPEWPPPPPSLRRDYDGRSVYTAPGTERYATRGHLAREEQIVERARRAGAPHLSREVAAARLGADADALDRVLHATTRDATQTTRTGLRYDQAAMIYEALTSPQRVSVGVGPAGSGKTHTVAEGARAWQAEGGKALGITASQAARNVLHGAGIRDAENSTQFVNRMDAGERLAERTLIVIDEGSTLSMHHLARIVEIAERDNAKVMVTGDHQQLAAVEAGGGMNLIARKLGHTQLAQPVRFKEPWEQQASLQLRRGDPAALDAYDEHGRILGGNRAETFEEARKAYVAGRVAGHDTLLMAYTREDCRTLSRMIRDDLIHLGLVDGGRDTTIAEGVHASAGDIIVARENDHDKITDHDPVTGEGHELANGDIFRVEQVTDRGLLVKRVLEADPETGAMRTAGKAVLYEKHRYPTTDLGYAVTGHNGMGGTVTRGEAVFTGQETREWAYVALTRGRERNTARVITRPREANPLPGTVKDAELARYEYIEAERAGLPPEEREKRDARLREPIGVLADALEREAGEPAATEYQDRQLLQADNLAVLHAHWADLTKTANRDRYRQILTRHLPDEHRGPDTSYSTWLYRTMRQAELAGVDLDDAVRTAIRSYTLDGARDVHAVLWKRLREMTEPMMPHPQGPYASRVPPVIDAGRQQYLRDNAQAMDDRKERIGKHAANASLPWATAALGPVPEDPGGRADWEKRAAHIGGYREIYGHTDDADPIGPEPSADSPDQRADWHTAHAAITRTDDVDVRALSDTQLWHRRGSYRTETAWAPAHPGRQLRNVRKGAETTSQQRVRARAEAQAARARGDADAAERHDQLEASAKALGDAYQHMETGLAEQAEDRQTWEKLTAAPRRLAVAADTELRRRHPEQDIEPLKSAEPEIADEQAQPERDDEGTPRPPEWVARLQVDREIFRAKAEERQNVRVPGEDHEWEDEGEAWPDAEGDPDAILQQPPPEMEPAPGVVEAARQAAEEAEPEAGELS
jgi:AAA domain/TrwC relaxase